MGRLRLVEGKGSVRVEKRYETDSHGLWAAITDPTRLAEWHARVDGDLRAGGQIRIRVEADDWEGTGHIEVCEPSRRLRITTRESEASYRKGEGVPPFDQVLDVGLAPEGDRALLSLEVSGLPLEPLAFYAAGWQIHTESLAAYLAGAERGDVEERWQQLVPRYQELAAKIG